MREAIGTVPEVITDLDQARQDLLEAVLETVLFVVIVDHLVLCSVDSQFVQDSFLSTLDYLSRVYLETASQQCKLFAISSILNIL